MKVKKIQIEAIDKARAREKFKGQQKRYCYPYNKATMIQFKTSRYCYIKDDTFNEFQE